MENTKKEQINNLAEKQNFDGNMVVSEKAEVMKLGEWVVTILITMIPLVNLVMLFVWSFSKGENPNKRNWARANLIWMGVSIIIAILIISSIVALFSAMVESNMPSSNMINLPK